VREVHLQILIIFLLFSFLIKPPLLLLTIWLKISPIALELVEKLLRRMFFKERIFNLIHVLQGLELMFHLSLSEREG